jgi:uncharacterized LabA/DUF88 family protein
LSKNVALFIDVANIYYAARGQDVDVDYIALLKHVTKGRDLIRAYAYSGLDPENENQRKFLDFLSKNGYKVVHKDIRKFGDGRVKANLDIELVVDLFRLQDRMDIAVIVSGDGDFASAIRALQDVGVRCEVISFRPNTSSDLIAVADEFTDIMKIIGIGRAKESKVPPMPEMPAKEVNPEFGFREASRGVAAAALAALREGEQPSRSRRGRGTRSDATPASAESLVASAPAGNGDEPAGPTTALESPVEGAETGEGARRRRRRRGGRGRGRSRRPDEALESGVAASPGEEIGWQEFDDISQLGELSDLGEPGEERQFGFAEADAATLAELGLAPQAAGDESQPAPSTEEPAAEPSRTPRRRAPRGGRARASTTTRAPAADAEEAAAPAPVDEAGPEMPAAKPRRRRAAASTSPETAPASSEDAGTAAPKRASRSRRSPRTTTPGSEVKEAAGSSEGALPRARRSRRAVADAGSSSPSGSGEATSSEATSSAEAADEGIWQRFRSGRRPARRTTS